MQPPVWVFGYGSLMWNPEFPISEKQIARLDGYHRSFCMRSIHHRGTVEEPGLVLALDRDTEALCEGVAFLMDPDHIESSLASLRERELVSSAYLETHQAITLHDGRRVEALTYVIDPEHVQYCGGLELEEQARIIARACGGRGPNAEYLINTTRHLEELGLHDPDLKWLEERVHQILEPSAPHT
jgi:cation transport protein ChaC